ncbi:MAG: hypothetical protein D3925_20335, partial [Candidatus Electrothrix sp. AR5]|nr:hypothetical protein [Candidatus Electrothrix sp. AR5]
FGSAYVFVRAADGTWSEQAKLTSAFKGKNVPFDPNYGFGDSVSISGDTALIGVPRDNDKWAAGSHGSVCVFVRAADGTWKEQVKLTGPHGANDFGKSVSIFGDMVVIGASGEVYSYTIPNK